MLEIAIRTAGSGVQKGAAVAGLPHCFFSHTLGSRARHAPWLAQTPPLSR
ncbi:MAG: hypothetical protein ACYTG0_37170 [Planctomycetota bacterium]